MQKQKEAYSLLEYFNEALFTQWHVWTCPLLIHAENIRVQYALLLSSVCRFRWNGATISEPYPDADRSRAQGRGESDRHVCWDRLAIGSEAPPRYRSEAPPEWSYRGCHITLSQGTVVLNLSLQLVCSHRLLFINADKTTLIALALCVFQFLYFVFYRHWYYLILVCCKVNIQRKRSQVFALKFR